MPGLTQANGPTYISVHSADVILSDIRPFKLKTDALRSINVLLDEILYNILSASGSLVTDRLRASLLSLMPTSLGKEALLEAEVELRAYWERTAPAGFIPSIEDDTATFHLSFIFELLRNKCEAYSTLNEADEDPTAEANITERFARSGASPPKAALVAPAALYLTAILEAVCEHVLSNVGRVAARDSSRASATANDLFTALCEDASIYGYFKTMKVYDQIEQLSKAPSGSRRSKSFTRNDKGSISRTSSPQQESVVTQALSSSLSRQSSEGSSAAGHAANAPSRSSYDKSRALRMFANGKLPHEREESLSGHKRSTSLVSEHPQQDFHEGEIEIEDAAMLQEFDDLMRSASTMKMSLTPDRLKTMEVYKQEKDQRGNRRPDPLSVKTEGDISSSRQPPLPSVRHVESIVEDDEESSSPKRSKLVSLRQASISASPKPSIVAPPSRLRSVSTSSAGVPAMASKPIRSPPGYTLSAFPLSHSNSASNPNLAYTRNLQANSRGTEANNGPTRKRTKQRNRESLDLDDIMNGDDEELEVQGFPARGLAAPTKRTVKVSSTTRDLMDFLAEGPPVPPGSGDGMRDSIAPGPPRFFGGSSASLEKPKTNRLQRMISKLNIGNEKPKPHIESPTKTSGGHYRTAAGSTPTKSGDSSPLANRPMPPRLRRPPQPISPPSSPSQESFVDENVATVPARKTSTREQHPGPIPSSTTLPSASKSTTQQTPPKSILKEIPSPKFIPHTNGNGNGVLRHVHPKPPLPDTHSSPPLPQPTAIHILSRKPVPKVDFASPPPAMKILSTPTPPPAAPVPSQAPTRPPISVISGADLFDMQRLFASATSADECRLIFDMYLTRTGVAKPEAKAKGVETTPYPTPSPSVVKQSPQTQTIPDDESLEHSVVDLLLSGGVSLAASGPSTATATATGTVTTAALANSNNFPSHPSATKARHLPRLPMPETSNTHGQEEEEGEGKLMPITSWTNTSEFPHHAALIPA